MASVPHTTTNPVKEAPSNSETAVGGQGGANLYPKDSTPAANISDLESKVGQTKSEPGSAEAAAEKLYEERIEEEYAKREGGA